MNPHASAAPQGGELWQAVDVTIGFIDGAFYRSNKLQPLTAGQALARLAAGETPKQVFHERLPLADVRSLVWIPAARTIALRRSVWRDPWWITVADEATGAALVERWRRLLGCVDEPETQRVGPHDLALDPGLGFGVLLGFLGAATVVLGAIEGSGDAALVGPVRRVRALAVIGEKLGVVGALAVGGIALAIGIGALWNWHRHRPQKFISRVPRT